MIQEGCKGLKLALSLASAVLFRLGCCWGKGVIAEQAALTVQLLVVFRVSTKPVGETNWVLVKELLPFSCAPSYPSSHPAPFTSVARVLSSSHIYRSAVSSWARSSSLPPPQIAQPSVLGTTEDLHSSNQITTHPKWPGSLMFGVKASALMFSYSTPSKPALWVRV